MQADWITVYGLAADTEGVKQMQEISLGPSDLGLAPAPLICSDKWWKEIESGERPTHVVEGTISKVYWGSMGDWPEFKLAGETTTTWTRKGNGRRYVEGLRARLSWVEHPWKTPGKFAAAGDISQIVLSIEIEDSPLRSAAIAPGPGGQGYEMARRNGDAVHYLEFQTSDSADRAIGDLENTGLTTRKYGGDGMGSWFVAAWHSDASAAERWRSDLEQVAGRQGGRYDGGEIVEGTVWGPRTLE